ncbi:MAG: hypothetical protein JSS82_07450 [Bacteroidetes bacterium]|nr:hypothetical protein [Bacteroidota bacterium]
MKKLLLLIPVITLSTLSCKEAADNTLNMKQMEEELYKRYPSVNRVSVEVVENSNVNITLGDKTLFAAPDEKKRQIVNDLGPRIIEVFDKGNWLDKGRIVFVKEETTLQATDSIVYTINLDSLKKTMKK